jgi:hypothetical protein
MSELIEQHVNERRKTLDVPSAFLSNEINNVSWTSNEIENTENNNNKGLNWINENNGNKKVTWTTPIVEQEYIIPSTLSIPMTQTKNDTVNELSSKVDSVLQQLSFITNYMRCSFRPTEGKISITSQAKKRERSVSF